MDFTDVSDGTEYSDIIHCLLGTGPSTAQTDRIKKSALSDHGEDQIKQVSH